MPDRIVTSLVLFSMLAACTPFQAKKYQAQSAAQPAPLKKIETASDDRIVHDQECLTSILQEPPKGEHRVEQTQTVRLVLRKQRVIQKNCAGNVLSEHFQTVQQPTLEIELTPVQHWVGQSYALPYNLTTCSSPTPYGEHQLKPQNDIDGYRTHLGFPRARFTVGAEPRRGSMLVRKNAENFIAYTFRQCANWITPTKCGSFAVTEVGTLILTVIYWEEEIHPAKEIQPLACPTTDYPTTVY